MLHKGSRRLRWLRTLGKERWQGALGLVFLAVFIAIPVLLMVYCGLGEEGPTQEERLRKEIDAMLAGVTPRPRTIDLTPTEALDMFRQELMEWTEPQNRSLAEWFTRECSASRGDDRERWLVSCPFPYEGETQVAQFWLYDDETAFALDFPVPTFTFANRVGLDVMGVLQEP